MKPWTMPDSFSANLLHDLKSISREFAVDRQTNHGEVASAAFDLVFNFRFGSISQLKIPVSVHKVPVLLDFFPVNFSWEISRAATAAHWFLDTKLRLEPEKCKKFPVSREFA
jgi:hypothetical protein